MLKIFRRNTFTTFIKRRGGESLMMAMFACALVALTGFSLTKLHNTSFRSLLSSETTMQAQHFAKAKMDYLMFKGYNNLAVQSKADINGTTFKDAVVLGTITTDADGVKKRTVTVSVYSEDEASPRATLQHVFYSNDSDMYVRNDKSPLKSISLDYDSVNDKLYAKVDGVEKPIAGAGVPAGTVLSWYGSIANIPDGFVLCDGSNGTPDLRSRFIVGAGSDYSLGAAGGATHVKLSWNEMPSHAHTRGTMNITGKFSSDEFGAYHNANARGEGAFYLTGEAWYSGTKNREDYSPVFGFDAS